MPNLEIFVAPTEFKFSDSGEPGLFTGYGSVYGILDSHKDVIEKGAFDATLATHQRNGTMPALYVEHSKYQDGGDPLPVGVYTKMESDEKGLKVTGKISNLDTDRGKIIRGLMQDGALKGLSIAFSVPPGGARMGKKQGEPRRTLTSVDLFSVDIVQSPSNSAAQIAEIKSAFAHLRSAGEGDMPFTVDAEAAIEYLSAAIFMQDKLMTGGWYSSPKDAAILMDNLRCSYKALTGESIPEGLDGWMKNKPFTIGVIRTNLVSELGLSRKRADEVAKLLFDQLPRDEGSKSAPTGDLKASFAEISKTLASI